MAKKKEEIKDQNENPLMIAEKQDEIVQSVIKSKDLAGFQRANLVSNAIVQLRELLSDEYMTPIMALQGSKLGFRTDKDLVKIKGGSYRKGPGYTMEVVRECLIEAVFQGLNPYNNQFNIIGGNMYPTKEGCGYLLNQTDGLTHSIRLSLPNVDEKAKSASMSAEIEWSFYDGKLNTTTIQIPVKIDQYTSVDAMVGKGTRKARAWLLSRITGQEMVTSDLEDSPALKLAQKVIGGKKEDSDPMIDRINTMIDQAKSTKDLDTLSGDVEIPEQLKEKYQDRYVELGKE